MADAAGFLSPLAIPLGISQGEPDVQPTTTAGMVSMLAFWSGGASVPVSEDGGGGVTPTVAYYMPTFRSRRR